MDLPSPPPHPRRGENTPWPYLFLAGATTVLLAALAGATCYYAFTYVPPATHAPPSFPATSHSGYLRVSGEDTAANLFYWFWEQAEGNASAPLLVWLQGGPGSSSMLGFFRENGPFRLVGPQGQPSPDATDGRELKLEDNPHSWHKACAVLWIDNPMGVGFSYSSPPRFVNSTDQAVDYLYKGLVAFLAAFPAYQGNPIYLMGESYAGKYIPALAYETFERQKTNEGRFRPSPLNLIGIGIGNSFVDPMLQVATLAADARERGLISQPQGNALEHLGYAVQGFIATGDSAFAVNLRSSMYDLITEQSNVNIYDIRLHHSYNYSDIEAFLRLPEVEKSLGIHAGRSYAGIRSKAAREAMTADILESQRWRFPVILANFKVLLYQGDKDMRDSVESNFAWITHIEWDGKEVFNGLEPSNWTAAGEQVGNARTWGNLTQLTIFNAGHLAPMDQPAVCLSMVKTFTQGGTFAVGKHALR